MRLIKNSTIIAMIVLLISCSQNQVDTDTTIDLKDFKIIEKKYPNMRNVGMITKAIKLETNKESLIAQTDRIIVDPVSEDFIIGDFRRASRVLRFNKFGKFICSYGKRGKGPAEYQSLKDFTIMSNGDVILLTSMKLLKFSKDGNFLLESRIPVFAGGIECIDDLLYISVLRYRSSNQGEKKAIIVLNPFFAKVGGIGVYDGRLDKYIFNVQNVMAKKGKKLYFIDHYDLNLNIYDTGTQKLVRLPFPNNNSILNKIWEKQRISDSDDKEILTKLHRFNGILSFEDKILLLELHRAEDLYRVWLLSLENKEILIFDWSSLYGDFREEEKTDLYFNSIPGTFKQRLIGVIDDVENFELYKKDYPVLKDFQFSAEENPMLAFFEFHQDM